MPLQRLLCGLVALCVLLSPTSALADENIRKGEGRFPFEETYLDNGMRVISLTDTSSPIAAAQVWYHVGSKDERPDRQGFAHMFEHMMFRGTEKLGNKEHFDFIRRTGGDCNAYTSFDETVYIQEFPSNQLEMVLWMEAERMANLKIDEGGFATERKVVEEERRLGLNQPYGDIMEQVLDYMFTVHPYRWSPIGKIEHLRASTTDDLQAFWDTYYVPNNATLVVVGDVSHDEVRRLAKKSFGWIPRCPEPPRVTITEPAQTEKRSATFTPKNGPVPIAILAFQAVPQGHPDSLPLEMLMNILGGGESSRLYLDVVRRKEVATMAMAMSGGFEQAGFAAAVGVSMPFGDTDAILDALWEQVELIKAEGVTEEEMEKVRHQVAREEVTGALTVASKASILGSAAVTLGDAQLANTRAAQMDTITAKDLKDVANRYLVEDRANEITIKPGLGSMLSTMLSMGGSDAAEETEEEEEEIEGGQVAKAGGPKAGAVEPPGYPQSPPVAPPLEANIDINGEERVLENGLRIVVVENHEVPFISTSLRFKVGAFTEDPDHPGTASMATSMITRGTFVNDAEALAAELEQHAIGLNAGAGHDSMNVGVSSLPDQFERSMRILSEVIQAPAFDEKEFDTLRKQTLTGMAISEKTPSVIADRTFASALWGNHPYGRPAGGTSDDIKELDTGLIEDWWWDNALPQYAVLYIAGDITPDRAEKVADRYLGSWEGEEAKDIPIVPAFSAPEKQIIKLVDRPGAIQSEIRAGHEGITRGNEYYAPGVVLTQVFGGAFSSRLMEKIRVELGLTYGASGGLGSRRFGGTFSVRTFTKTPTTAETVQAVIDEVERMRTEPPTEEELRDAVDYLAGSFAGSLETPQAVTGRLWTIELNNLPGDYWASYLSRIGSTSSEDVAAAAIELLGPERMIMVVVGDAEKIKESLEDIAEVELITEEG